MKKRIFSVLLGVMTAMSLMACGSDPDAVWYGTVTNAGGLTENSVITEISSGMETYGQSVEHQTKLYTPEEETREAISAQLESAAKDDKVKVILAEGSEMEIPVYEAQNAHHGTKFVLFDGEPKKDEDSDASIRKNTTVIQFSVYDLGYMAGYAAVREGYRTIGYLTGTKTDDSSASYEGFLAGCEAAADELHLAKGDVVLNQEFADSDALMPLRMTEAMNWYNNGTELIATDSAVLMPAIAKAADATDQKAAACGFLYSGTSEHVLYSSVPDYSGATQAVLAAAEKNKTFHGGETQSYGFIQHAVRLQADFAAFANFNESVYNTFLETASVGIGERGAEDAESGETQTNSLVTVNVMKPQTPDETAGLGGATKQGEATESMTSMPEAASDSEEAESETESTDTSDSDSEE